MKPEYDVDFFYSRHGSGVGIATFQYDPYQLFGNSRHRLATMSFIRDGKSILMTDGEPNVRLDSGYYADDWRSISRLAYDDSPDDGTLEDWLDDEYPGLLDAVRDCLKNHRSHKLSLVSRKPIRVPARGKARPVTRAGQLVRAFLGFRGTDDVGHKVIVRSEKFQVYYGFVCYETRSWTEPFIDWYERWVDEPGNDDEPELEALSSYEIGVV